MAQRWHVNKKGEPGVCKAEFKCDFANDDGQEPPHFGTKKEAQAAVDKALEHLSVPTGLKKKSESEEIPKWKADKIRRANAPLTSKKFAQLHEKQKELEEEKAVTHSNLIKAQKAFDRHENSGYPVNAAWRQRHYELTMIHGEAGKNNLDAETALKKFNALYGHKIAKFKEDKEDNIDREEYKKLKIEEKQLKDELEEAQLNFRDIDEAPHPEDNDDWDEYFRVRNQCIDMVSDAEKRIDRFNMNNEYRMELHVEKFGEWGDEDEFIL